MRLTDALLGGFFALFGIFVLGIASQFASFPSQPYGAALLPSILAVGFLVAGVLLIVRDLRQRRGNSGVPGHVFALVPDLQTGGAPGLLAVLANVLAHILLTPRIGFLPVSLIGLTALFMILRLNAVKSVLLAVSTTLVCWWLFAGLLRVPLPRGFLDGVI